MSWKPTWTISIEGTDYTGETLVGGRITYGTQDPTESLRPATGTLTLLNGLDGLNVDLMDSVRIYIATTGGTAPVFTGYVSDVNYALDGRGVSTCTLQVISPVAKYARRTAGGTGFVKQLDGERVAAILAEAQSVTWLEAGETWANAVGTWADLDDLIGTISPGSYDLSAKAADSQTVSTLLLETELSGMGHLGETPSGKVNYQAAADRLTDAMLNGYTDFQAEDVLLDGISSEMSTATIANDYTVTTATGSESTATDDVSIATYGRIEQTVNTQLDKTSDADIQAARYAALYSRPRRYLSQMTVPLSTLAAADRDALVTDIRRGLPVRIYGLPPAIASDPYAGFLEGWTWDLDSRDVLLTMSVSDYALSVPSQSWRAVSNTLTWSTISGAPTWADLEVLA